MSLPGQFLQSTYLCSHRPRDAVAVVGARSQYDGNGGYAAAGAWCKDARCLSQPGWNMMKPYMLEMWCWFFWGVGAEFFCAKVTIVFWVRFRLCFFSMTLCLCVCCDLSWSLSVHGFVCLVTWSAFRSKMCGFIRRIIFRSFRGGAVCECYDVMILVDPFWHVFLSIKSPFR